MTPEQCTEKYGAIVNGKWVDEAKWMITIDCTRFDLPWDTTQSAKYPHHIYINKDCAEPLAKALQNLKSRCYATELKTFDGCFNIRATRGADTQSAHSWGLALDLNAAENALGQIPKFSEGFVRCFEDAGFKWGGRWPRKDGMHFSLAGF